MKKNKNTIRELEVRLARLEKRAFIPAQKVWETANKILPQINRLKGGALELIRLITASLKSVWAELNILVRRKNKKKILDYMKTSFEEVMRNAFQPFVSTSEPPELIKFLPDNLLGSIFRFKGKEYRLQVLLRHDAVTGQGAYNAYNEWVTEYGLYLDYLRGVYPPKGSKNAKKMIHTMLQNLKIGRLSKLAWRFFNIWIKVTSQIGLVTGLATALSASALVFGVRGAIRLFTDLINKKIDKELGKTELGNNPLFDPDKTAAMGRLSSLGQVTLMLESYHRDCLTH